MKKRIALIFGGEGYERDVSEKSAGEIYSFIDKDTYEVLPIGIFPDGRWYVYTGKPERIGCGEWRCDRAHLKETHPVYGGFSFCNTVLGVHAAIIALHGDFGEDGSVQGALKTAHIKYVGEDVYSSSVTQDKAYTKAIAFLLRIPTAKWITLNSCDPRTARRMAEENIGYPMFIKPARLGSSFGASAVMTKEDFDKGYSYALSFDTRILIEQFISSAYEAECAFLSALEYEGYATGRVNSNGDFYSFSKKYLTEEIKTEPLCDKETEEKIIEYSKALRDYIGIKSISRFDYFVTDNGEIYFNEINSFPGMTKTSLYPKMTVKMGIRDGEFINLLLAEVTRDGRSF